MPLRLALTRARKLSSRPALTRETKLRLFLRSSSSSSAEGMSLICETIKRGAIALATACPSSSRVALYILSPSRELLQRELRSVGQFRCRAA